MGLLRASLRQRSLRPPVRSPWVCLRLSVDPFAAGVGGLFFDSLLGATVERKGWIGNDLVNFSSTAFAAAVALAAIWMGQGYLVR